MTPTIVPCSKVYRAGDVRVRPVALAVLHWTASPPKAPEAPDEARMRAWLADAERQTSTHIVILRDGRVLQSATLGDRTWHAGGSAWVDPAGHVQKSINMQSIGIDLENVGYVKRAPDGVGFIDGYGGRYRGAEPVKTTVGWFEPYTAAQLASLAEVVRWLSHDLPALRDPRRWVGHSEIQPGKLDPGPLFPWEAVRRLVASAGASA
jgi:N-acetyl-anhydromuramyl-L-alanine amidase AmpD